MNLIKLSNQIKTRHKLGMNKTRHELIILITRHELIIQLRNYKLNPLKKFAD